MSRNQHHNKSGDRGFTSSINSVSIHKRPKNIENRKSIGHWEGDLISGSKNTHDVTDNVLSTTYLL